MLSEIEEFLKNLARQFENDSFLKTTRKFPELQQTSNKCSNDFIRETYDWMKDVRCNELKKYDEVVSAHPESTWKLLDLTAPDIKDIRFRKEAAKKLKAKIFTNIPRLLKRAEVKKEISRIFQEQ